MSSLKEQLKNKLKTNPTTAHSQLIEPNENVNVHVNVNKPKRKKFEEKFTRQTYYIENELIEKLNQLAGDEKGEKTRIVNEALKSYLTHNS